MTKQDVQDERATAGLVRSIVEEERGGSEITMHPTAALAGEIEVLHRCAVSRPRDMKAAQMVMLEMLSNFPALAEMGTYAIPYKEHTEECKAKPWKERASCRCPVSWVRGPSIELMVPMAAAWKNNLHGARLVPVGQETLVQGIYVDVEGLNVVVRDRQVSRMKRKKNGETFWLGQDEYWKEVEIQASKMHRNAIKRGIPRFVWQPLYEAALDVRLAKEASGKIPARWAAACDKFARKGITPEDLLATLGVQKADDLSPEHMVNLGSLWNASEAGLLNLREMFGVPDEPDGLPARLPGGSAIAREDE